MEDNLKQSILKTLSYFDIFDYPLTSEELYRWLFEYDNKNSYSFFLNQLQQLQHLEQFEHKNGYYFLQGKESNVAKRESRVKFFEKKMKIAKKGIKKISWIPFVRAVFVCNTMASSAITEDSDIDVFIIVRNGRIFLARLLVTFVLSLFRLRRTKKKIKNKICLSFYVTDNNLNLKNIAIEELDVYLMYWIDQLIPVYDPENLHKNIRKENEWIKKYLPNSLQEYSLVEKWKVQNNKIKKIFEKMWGGNYGDLLESQSKGIQKARMKMNQSSLQNEDDTRVVISDKMLKFHENDRREEYREKWLKRI